MSLRQSVQFVALGFGMLVVSAASSCTWAADAFFDEVPIVLTASRMAQSPVDAPVAVTLIDREMIDASGFTEVHELLRLVPGFLVADWPDGSPVVANHGMSDAYDRRIKVMVNGHTVNSPAWGNTNWHDLPLRVNDIERIEVVRGPNGAAYGVNAFDGVVNIITRSPATESGVALISRIGANGFHDHGFRINGDAEAAIDWRLSGSHRRSVNFRPYRNDKGVLEARKIVERSVLNFGATAQLSTQDELQWMLGFSSGGTDRGAPGNSFHPLREDDTRAQYVHLGWKRSFAVDSELSVQFHHQRERTRAPWQIMLGRLGPFAADKDSDVRREELEVQYGATLSPAWRFMLGAGVRREAARSRSMFETGGTVSGVSSQVFGSVVWSPVERLRIDLGGTLEDHHYSGSLFSPRLALGYALTPDSALRFSSGVSYRTPSLVESHALQAIRVGTEIKWLGAWAGADTQPERVRHAELGYAAMFREQGLGIDVRAFYQEFDDYIDDERCWFPSRREAGLPRPCPSPPADFAPIEWDLGFGRPSAFVFRNVGSFRLSGGEFSIDWRRPGWGRILLSQSVIDIDVSGDNVDKDFKYSVPNSITSLLLIKDLPGRWRASLGYYRHATLKWRNDGDRVPEQGRVDLKLSHRFGGVNSGNEVAVVVQSAGGRYADFHGRRYRHEPQVFGSLRLTW
ncbi:TonB-dependent receptor plug domain-containing protein [Thauera sp.]|uniref:TonB-dependent receptor plug domain-containing protein n=1 Tax=Thauera sp. TaxID=1905334 RepID=UPI0039E52CB3